jgi:hypothetical protein
MAKVAFIKVVGKLAGAEISLRLLKLDHYLRQ